MQRKIQLLTLSNTSDKLRYIGAGINVIFAAYIIYDRLSLIYDQGLTGFDRGFEAMEAIRGPEPR